VELSKKYQRTAAQIVIRWILQQGVSVNTMSTKQSNIAGNYNVMDFCLSSIDMTKINSLTTAGVRIVDKDRVPWAPEWD